MNKKTTRVIALTIAILMVGTTLAALITASL